MTAKVKREIKRWPKSENEALRDDVAAGRRRLHIRSICPSPREATTARAWIMQPPRLADIAEQDYFLPQREAYHYAKTTVGSPEVY